MFWLFHPHWHLDPQAVLEAAKTDRVAVRFFLVTNLLCHDNCHTSLPKYDSCQMVPPQVAMSPGLEDTCTPGQADTGWTKLGTMGQLVPTHRGAHQAAIITHALL